VAVRNATQQFDGQQDGLRVSERFAISIWTFDESGRTDHGLTPAICPLFLRLYYGGIAM
jgi:hypothetical protein